MIKDSLIKGTIILTLAALIARVLGVIQRVPLKHLLDDSGMATYGIAYNLYFLFLVIATAGIPNALSKLVSEKTALGEYAEAKRINAAAIWFAIVAGLLVTGIVWFSADYYAVHIGRDPDAALAIRALAPALLLFPVIAMMRGYFLGRQMMMAGGLSQVVEQLLRVIPAIVLAYFILQLGYRKEWAIAGASFGGVTGSIGAFAVMLYFWQKLKKQDKLSYASSHKEALQHRKLPLHKIYASIFRYSIPISLIAMVVPLIYFIDSSTVIALIEGRVGYDKAKEALGILTGRAQSLSGIPVILSIALSQSIIPIISSAYANSDRLQVNHQASQAFRISIIGCIPIVIFLTVAARPVNGFLFGDILGTAIIILLVLGTVLQILMMISGSILMGLGQPKAPMFHVFAGIAVKLGCTFLLAPWLGIYGIIIATSLCFIVIMLLNLHALKKTVAFNILGKKWTSLVGVTLIVTLAGIGAEWIAHTYIQTQEPFIMYGIQSFLLGSLVIVMYLILLIKLQVIGPQDIVRFPVPLQKVITRISGAAHKGGEVDKN